MTPTPVNSTSDGRWDARYRPIKPKLQSQSHDIPESAPDNTSNTFAGTQGTPTHVHPGVSQYLHSQYRSANGYGDNTVPDPYAFDPNLMHPAASTHVGHNKFTAYGLAQLRHYPASHRAAEGT
ncbi:uncharacterized protein AB675_8500 [Cyphellophora attinorum]|uniref:Uncharacterized protein n=1 Tax=Cyphellophora attinorum TaxID=1664694 RepID=A0A0N0NRE2_9EURO|nr:uncharacterized protein AB675_8500 [Phialophora attinorum]KPI44729.1 hypothetical protein AB675_8500 [Phialophora attinorum]